jgi:hypothetical protein
VTSLNSYEGSICARGCAQPEGFCVVGTAVFFVGLVRPPLPGIFFTAMLIPTQMRNAPINGSSQERSLERELGQREQTTGSFEVKPITLGLCCRSLLKAFCLAKDAAEPDMAH